MPLVIAAADRKLLIFVAVFVLLMVTGLVLLSTEEGDDIGYPSSYSTKSHGAKAAYMLLQASGYDVRRWVDRPSKLPKEGSGYLFILADPFRFSDKADQREVRRFVSSGGRVLATGFMAGMMLSDEKAVAVDPENIGWKQYEAQIPSRFTRGGTISMERAAVWKVEDASFLHHYGNAERGVVVSYPLGQGEIAWWGSSGPLTNVGITRDGNLELFLNTIDDRSTKILWDEYFHGSRPSVWSYAWGPALAWTGIQLGVLGLAVVFGFSRRSGPIRPLPQVSRLSPLEFVETLGGLYHRARARQEAVDAMYRRFRYLLGKRLGMQNDVGAEQMARDARERLGYKDEGFLKVLTDCERAIAKPDLRDAEALRLVQSLHEHASNLKLIDKT